VYTFRSLLTSAKYIIPSGKESRNPLSLPYALSAPTYFAGNSPDSAALRTISEAILFFVLNFKFFGTPHRLRKSLWPSSNHSSGIYSL
jgi:hypothetical protein